MKIIDLHCDSLYKFIENGDGYSLLKNDGHISVQSLFNGNYIAQCFAVYTPLDLQGEDAYLFFRSQYKRFLRAVRQCNILSMAKDKRQITKNLKKGKISAILTVENAELLNGRLDRIKEVENLGVKILGLIHNGENCIGFPHSCKGYLKSFGKEVIDAVNNTEIIIDVSHLNLEGFFDVANISKKPFIASHSACRNLQENTRNLFDEQIRIIAKSGGVIGIPFYSVFLNGGNKTECEDVIRHLEHLIKIGGEDIAAFGTDFDGMQCDLFPKNAAQMPILAEALIKKFGFKIAEKVCFKNAMRIL